MIPPSPRASPAEQALRWFSRPYDLLRECAAELGDAFVIDLGTHGPYAIFSRPDEIRAIFTGEPADLHAGEGNGVLRPFLGDGSLLLLEEERHLRERRLLLPSFRPEQVARHAELIRSVATAAVRSWPEGGAISVQERMQAISLDVILQVVFGFGATREESPETDELVALVRGFVNDSKFNLALLGQLGGKLRTSPTFVEFEGRLTRIRALLAAEVERRRTSPTRAGDVLSLLLDARYDDGRTASAEDLRDELLTLLVTGYETTATALAWAFQWIDREPPVREALTNLVRARPSGAAYDDPYLDAFVREVLRIHPIIPIVARRAQRDLRIGRFDVPKGQIVAPCIFLAHHREDVYHDAGRFDPERFLGRRYGPYEYLPFGGGARRCLGMTLALAEMKIVLLAILERVSLRVGPGPLPEPRRRSVTIAPSGGATMQVHTLEAR
jgi:cytochrome P450